MLSICLLVFFHPPHHRHPNHGTEDIDHGQVHDYRRLALLSLRLLIFRGTNARGKGALICEVDHARD
jgi:hypothetical protein